MGRDQDEAYEVESSVGELSSNSDDSSSSSSSELIEDASSSFSSFATSTSGFSDPSASPMNNAGDNGPLYELSDLLDHLPIKRGLSKFYEGKSQSFTSLARVKSIEDLAKGENPNQKRLKLSKSFEEELDNKHRSPLLYSPRPAVSKNASRIVSSSPFSAASNHKRSRQSLLGLHRAQN